MLFAYPTTSGALHVGHGRSYVIPDVIARFKRMQGFNVFFPLGFHATGIDCIAIYEKICDNPKNGPAYGIPTEDAEKLRSPIDVEKYLERTILRSLEKLGISLDLRAKVSTIDASYSRFIQWQFQKLREQGYLIQRDYHLPWRPRCNHPVSLDAAEADVSEWKGATIKEYTIIKFRDKEGRVFPASTLRPETISGVTNLWLNPKADYVEAEINGESWITSRSSCQKLTHQGKNVGIMGEISGSILEGTIVFNSVTGDSVRILMADFVDPDEATGVVMSVPAHDPYDYLYVKSRYPEIEPIQVVEVKGMGRLPAKYVIEELDIKEVVDSRLEDAVKNLYRKENGGRMVPSINKFGGMGTVQARKAIKIFLAEIGVSDIIFELSTKPIYCPCGAEITIKVIRGQWFINYADLNWKKKAKKCIEKMKTFPPEYKRQLPSIVDWLVQRPCVRRRGLGTPFPFEEGWVIDALSDYTIYMAFFIVTKHLNAGFIGEDQLINEFFDFEFLGKGSPSEVAEKIEISEELLRRIREEFNYWYPVDLNAGGKEHKTVHFPFFIFTHVVIFPEEHWPKGIFVNWHLVAYGQKMSKHLGNVVFLDETLERWGTDTVRFYLLHGSNQWRDFDWRDEECRVYQRHLERFQNLIKEVMTAGNSRDSVMSTWLKSAFNLRIQQIASFMEQGEIRKAVDVAFFGIWNDIDWYRRRTGRTTVGKGYVKTWLRVLAPFIPHICEQTWRRLGERPFISTTSWPRSEKEIIEMKVIELEKTLKRTMEDVRRISELTGRRGRLFVYTVSKEEFHHFSKAKEFLRKELGFNAVHVFRTDDNKKYDAENRAGRARPEKPGIYLE